MSERPAGPPSGIPRAAWLGLPQLWSLVALAGIWIVLNLALVRPHDFWWHLRVGQWIVENGRVPAVDLFSFTQAGQPYEYDKWLMGVVFYLLFQGGGEPLIILANAVLITSGYGLLWAVCRWSARGDLRWAAVATLAAAALGFDNWNVRAQSASCTFFAATLFLLERHERARAGGRFGRWGDAALWALPPAFAVWANCHGAFVLGLLLLGLDLTAALLAWRQGGAFPWQLALVSALCGAATLLTPTGLEMGRHVSAMLQDPTIRRLTVEWAPPTIRERQGQLLFGLAAALVALLCASRARPTAREALRLLAFGVLALAARRNVAWFGFVAAPVAAASLIAASSRRGPARASRPYRPFLSLAVASLTGLLALLSLPWFRPLLPLPEWRRSYLSPETPVSAAAYLRSLPEPVRPFHTEGYGSYLLWAAPEIPVFVDTRLELYPPSQWDDYLALGYARYDWEAILERYEVDALVLDREKQEMLIAAAAASPGWERVFEDAATVIFRRTVAP